MDIIRAKYLFPPTEYQRLPYASATVDFRSKK